MGTPQVAGHVKPGNTLHTVIGSSFNVRFDYNDVPTIRDFALSDMPVRGLMGPFGSGKSSGCVMEIARRACAQWPGRDGVRRSRWAAIRNTNREIDDTTLKTFMYWMSQFGDYQKTPRNFILNKLKAPDGSPVEAEILFRPLDKPDDVDNLLSLELTGAWFNEVREIPKIIWDTMQGRVGRYPAAADGGCAWAGIFGDTNPPDTDHWFYYLFEEDKPRVCPVCKMPDGGPVPMIRQEGKNYALPQFCPNCNKPESDGIPISYIWKQPSGRSQEAENLRNLPKGYYSNLMIGKDPAWITVYVDGKYGYVRDGRPVYPNWSDHFHLALKDEDPHRSYPLILSFDFDSHPACVICQYFPQGVLKVYDEFVGEGMGSRRFLAQVVKPYVTAKYYGIPIIITGDPSGIRKSYNSDERNAFLEIKDAFGQFGDPAWTNAWDARFGAVDELLVRRVEGNKGAIQLNPRCKLLHKGFLGEYRMRRIQVTGQERFQDRPEKNLASHPHDALQYAAMKATGRSGGIFQRRKGADIVNSAPVSINKGWA